LGVGNLGHALLQNFPFSRSGFLVDAAFDVSPAVIGTTIGDVPVYAMSGLEDYVKTHAIDVVVLTVPKFTVQEIADHLMACGIKGFWNFTNLELTAKNPDVKIENVHFADSLLTLSYHIVNR
ncbi:MAG: redox-sensing transcriptional repressor Rex, partial [Oscillospiraceae bacterium]